MFNLKNAKGWIGCVAVIPTDGGVWLVDARSGKHIFCSKESEGEG